ncbi:MAG TPA: hypothetical protein VFF95_03860 [Candidatus Binatus sp.]|jgi:hypothetical protein|nr:hypothetical protein [Candidatus Binatus sp.]
MNERERMLRVAIGQLEDFAQEHSCPIYDISESRGDLTGSGFFLKLDGQLILVTAAHVLENIRSGSLYLPGQGTFVPLEGHLRTTLQYDTDGRPRYGLDIAWVVLSSKCAESVSAQPLGAEDLDPNDIPRVQVHYGFAGFPASQNKPRPNPATQLRPGFVSTEKGCRTFLPKSVFCAGLPANDSVYAALNLRKECHFAMTFDRRHMIARDLKEQTAPDPHGMSGGPVWRLGGYQEIERGLLQPRIIALAVEYHAPIDALVGVRISLLVGAMRNMLDGAVRLPVSRLVKVNVQTRVSEV